MSTLLITAGRGPEEVRTFVAELGPALVGTLEARGLRIIGIEAGPGHVRIAFEGDVPVHDLLGTHELVAPVRGRGARRRWFAGVSLADEAPAVVILDPRDVDVRADRAGGPGGQHVNTTASAVRATHRPTGLSVRVTSERSQHANRREALRLLARQLVDRHQAALAAAADTGWRRHDQVQRGAPVGTWRRYRGQLVLEAHDAP